MFAFLVSLALIFIFILLLTPLQQEGLLVEDQIVEDTGEEYAFKHDQVAHNLTCQECILKLLILDEVIQPLLAKPRHT